MFIDFWSYMVGMTIVLADVSDFKDGEIIPLALEEAQTIHTIGDWDGKLHRREPIHGDIGIDNKRNSYWYNKENKWISINHPRNGKNT